MSGPQQRDTTTNVDQGERRGSVVALARAATFLVVSLAVFAYVACAADIAGADVDMSGRLEKVAPSLKSSPGEAKPLATSANGEYKCVDPYSVVANWYYYFAIGNCASGWDLEVVSYASENTETHEHSYGGFVNNAFSGCGWINTAYPLEKLNSNKYSACAGSGSSREFKVAESSFMERYNRGTVGDGNPVVNKVPCPEYANYRPWSSNNVEKELIRTAPEYAASSPGSNYPALKWRYTTKYDSTDGTGQYVMVRDDRITEAGEGNWVFVPRSCLPSTLPENAEERLPPPPTVTTNGASGVATPNATLNATVNPNGVDTKYFFEYGTTTGYGSYTTTENAGAGTGNVNVSASISGLAPGTTYYFRIVASSAIGEVFGGPVAFTTQPPPEVSTESASEINQVQAQLNGSVNPKGLETHYHFEYGKTESYGSSTSSGDADAGTSSVPVSATVTGLEPDTIYHYRLVASSSAGTTYGSGYTFTTLYVIDAFYRGTTGGLHNTLWNGSYWSSGALGPENVMEGNPSAVSLPEGKMDVFYRNKKGGLENAYWSGAWYFGALGPEKVMEGNPSAIALPEGKMDVFYRNKKAGLENAYWDGSAWSFSALGPENVMTGEPYALTRPGGLMNVFYRNKKGGLENAYWDGSAWSFSALGPENVMEGNPSAVSLPEGKMDVFYRNKKGGMENAYFSGAWSFSALGPENVMEGNPSAVSLPEGKMDVFFRNKTGGLENYYWSAAWYFGALGTEKVMTGDPGALALPNGVMDVFYRNTSGAAQNAFWNLSGWSFGPVGPEKTVAGEISAVDVL